MPRPMWNGSISFGLVNVPVKLFRAQAPKDVRFHQLHESDGSRVQQKRFCAAEEKEISYDEIVKGYEIAPDSYVVIDPNEESFAQLESGTNCLTITGMCIDEDVLKSAGANGSAGAGGGTLVSPCPKRPPHSAPRTSPGSTVSVALIFRPSATSSRRISPCFTRSLQAQRRRQRGCLPYRPPHPRPRPWSPA